MSLASVCCIRRAEELEEEHREGSENFPLSLVCSSDWVNVSVCVCQHHGDESQAEQKHWPAMITGPQER